MVGVKFGEKHSYKDFGLVLSKKEVGLPEPKTDVVSVTGRDGSIDLSEAYNGMVNYEDRKLTFTFTVPNAVRKWAHILSEVSNYLHGKKMEIVLDDDRGFYYYGRCGVNEYKSNKTLGTLSVECEVEPYKTDVNSAGQPWLWDSFSFLDGIIYTSQADVHGTAEINLINRAKVVSPTFTCTTPMTVTFNGKSYELNAGKTTLYDILLQQGDNMVIFKGNGTVKIEYKARSL